MTQGHTLTLAITCRPPSDYQPQGLWSLASASALPPVTWLLPSLSISRWEVFLTLGRALSHQGSLKTRLHPHQLSSAVNLPLVQSKVCVSTSLCLVFFMLTLCTSVSLGVDPQKPSSCVSSCFPGLGISTGFLTSQRGWCQDSGRVGMLPLPLLLLLPGSCSWPRSPVMAKPCKDNSTWPSSFASWRKHLLPSPLSQQTHTQTKKKKMSF